MWGGYLMRAICGLILPTSGEVRINGQVLGKDISFPPSIGALLEQEIFSWNEAKARNCSSNNGKAGYCYSRRAD